MVHRSCRHSLSFTFGLFLFFALAGTAHAAPITGQIGVGTWNTQAEFTDVKVVKGAQTLYQSDFTSGAVGWTTSGGTWSIVSGSLRQTGAATPALALYGAANWSDYTLTLKARKLSGNEGFLITFGSPGAATKTWWNIGGWGNTQHALEAPGISAPAAAGTVQTGRWYSIRIELQGADVRCYLDNVLVHDTERVLDSAERAHRFAEITTSPGFALLNSAEQQRARNLAARVVFIGAAARATFAAMPSGASFAALSATSQAAAIRKVIRNLLTWDLGWGYDGIDAARRQTIIDAMDGAVMLHNALGLFDKHVTANNSPGTPTADANYDGQIRFGGSYNYRVALHELEHCLGVGTITAWGQMMVNGQWTGQYGNTQMALLDGAGAVVHGDGMHFWPYGLNYDNESSPENDRRHVLVVAALRRDMGVATPDVTGVTSVAGGIYRITPRHAQTSALDVMSSNPANGARIDINRYSGAARQQFVLDPQSDGTYRIRTVLPGSRAVELPNGVTDSGTGLRLWDDNGNPAQRWYLIPTDGNWYRIAPANNALKCADVAGIATTDGSLVQTWDYWDGLNQQWFLTLLSPSFRPDELGKALVMAGGLLAAGSTDRARLDVAGGATSGTVDLADAVAIARKLSGLDRNP